MDDKEEEVPQSQPTGIAREWFMWALQVSMDRALEHHDNDHARAFAWTAYHCFRRDLDMAGSFPLYPSNQSENT